MDTTARQKISTDVKDLKNKPIRHNQQWNIHAFQAHMEYSQNNMLGHNKISLTKCKSTEIIQVQITFSNHNGEN